MTIGKLARKLLGNKIFSIIARYYRAIFVDLEKVCRSFPEIEDNAHILDVGGGDGELINILLSKIYKDNYDRYFSTGWKKHKT